MHQPSEDSVNAATFASTSARSLDSATGVAGAQAAPSHHSSAPGDEVSVQVTVPVGGGTTSNCSNPGASNPLHTTSAGGVGPSSAQIVVSDG